ncbi:Protein of unknown function DUF617 [Macleaya cordata]|uniref:Protein MIZU-KUSSEI 1 n=1 Tax=Macleaya cordata TaxID=56857 RepID=A0A200PUU7_MACCD|nr:Protein of unknown function DUF617 [Macleaya cordata]
MAPPPPLPQPQLSSHPQFRPPSSTVTPTASSTPSPTHPHISLQNPNSSTNKKPSKPGKFFRRFRSVFRSFPIITPTPCKMPTLHVGGGGTDNNHMHGGVRMTGTLFGYRRARINLAIQQNPKCLPMLILELAIPTAKLLQEMGSGLVRIALECEKKHPNEKTKLIEEPVWTMYCNGKKLGYGVKRDPTQEDLNVMQLLHAVSMGAGVLPTERTENNDMTDGEMTYMRAHFERVTGSKDSETFYMMNPDGNSGPELTIFFVRI